MKKLMEQMAEELSADKLVEELKNEETYGTDGGRTFRSI